MPTPTLERYPNGGDLLAFYMAAGLVPDPVSGPLRRFDWQLYTGAAVAEWEKRTGYTPFLSSGAVETKAYDPPGANRAAQFYTRGGSRVLELRSGLLSFVSLTIGTTNFTDGTPLVQGESFGLKPLDGYTDTIEFYYPQFGGPGSIRITGVWGRQAALSDDVRLAILQIAAAKAAPTFALTISKGRLRSQEGDVTRDYGRTVGTGPLVEEAGAWKAASDAAVRAYKRITL